MTSVNLNSYNSYLRFQTNTSSEDSVGSVVSTNIESCSENTETSDTTEKGPAIGYFDISTEAEDDTNGIRKVSRHYTGAGNVKPRPVLRPITTPVHIPRPTTTNTKGTTK